MPEGTGRSVNVRLRAAVESSPSGLLMIDSAGSIVLVNREVERLFGYSREELLGRQVEMLVPERFRDAHPGFRAGFFAHPRVRSMGAGRDLFGLHKSGTEVPVEIGLTPVATEDGLFVISSIIDISARVSAEEERRQLEEQLRQSQKMEAVGRLAGGVAHDFNNILASIVGFAELLRDHAENSDTTADLDEILRAAQRGQELVDRILRFGRRQERVLKPVDLCQAVGDTARMLRATLPAAIEIQLALDSAPGRILADATSVQQVLMNLATNAADAMPKGGRIEIAAESFYAHDSFCRAHPGLREGHYAVIRVRDSGPGMSAETLTRALEPFFTTKAPGEGTGLGLAIVHGIVRDHGGTMWLDSAPGEGAAVSCLFPVPGTEVTDQETTAAIESPRGRGERVLLVDDEPALARLGKRRLDGIGYQVESTTDPVAALDVLRSRPRDFCILITDFSMPGMDGVDLAREARRVVPDLPILLLTGYAEAFSGDEAAAVVNAVLHKPIRTAELATAVRDVLEPRRASRSRRQRSHRPRDER